MRIKQFVSAAAAVSIAIGTVGQAQQVSSSTAPLSAVAHPDSWPVLPLKRHHDPRVEVDAMLKRMSIDDKVGQLLQVDIASITPQDLETDKLGSIPSGGNS